MSHRLRTSSEAREIVRWQFQREQLQVTCVVRDCGNRSFDVVTLPHWNVAGGAIESFSEPSQALQRHAAIATALRDTGWTLSAYTR